MDTNDEIACERLSSANERRLDAIDVTAFDDSRGVSATQSGLRDRAAILIIAIFWFAQISIATSQQLLSPPSTAFQLIVPRVISAVCGAVISLGMVKVLDALKHS